MQILRSGTNAAAPAEVDRLNVPEALDPIAETARDHGLATLGYSETPYVTADFGLSQGFDFFEEVPRTDTLHSRNGKVAPVDSAARIERMLDRVSATNPQPFLYTCIF
ncbi:MAG: hypothetical protein GY910_13015 [bacterium]|nr:hypothetical protein [Deltaproteobacteria bacterium]MCP4905891.1 hypothetical protein [bacterium]